MKIVTSNKQNFFNAMVRSASLWLSVVFSTVLVHYFSPKQYIALSELLFWAFIAIVGFSVLFFLWYYLLNSGPGKIENPSIEFTGEGVILNRLGERHIVSWLEFKGYNVSGFLAKQVCVNKLNGSGFQFEYYLFNSSDREKIFSGLESTSRS